MNTKRKTNGRFVGTGEEFTIEDDYADPVNAHRVLANAWVGTTTICEENIVETNGEGQAPLHDNHMSEVGREREGKLPADNRREDGRPPQMLSYLGARAAGLFEASGSQDDSTSARGHNRRLSRHPVSLCLPRLCNEFSSETQETVVEGECMTHTDGQADVQLEGGTQVAGGPTYNQDIVMQRTETDPFVSATFGSSRTLATQNSTREQ